MPEADVRFVQLDRHIQPPHLPDLTWKFFEHFEALARTARNVSPAESRAPATIGVGPKDEVAGELAGDFSGSRSIRHLSLHRTHEWEKEINAVIVDPLRALRWFAPQCFEQFL